MRPRRGPERQSNTFSKWYLIRRGTAPGPSPALVRERVSPPRSTLGSPARVFPHDHGDRTLYPWLPHGGVRLLPYLPARPERFTLRPMRRRRARRFAAPTRRLHPDLSVGA